MQIQAPIVGNVQVVGSDATSTAVNVWATANNELLLATSNALQVYAGSTLVNNVRYSGGINTIGMYSGYLNTEFRIQAPIVGNVQVVGSDATSTAVNVWATADNELLLATSNALQVYAGSTLVNNVRYTGGVNRVGMWSGYSNTTFNVGGGQLGSVPINVTIIGTSNSALVFDDSTNTAGNLTYSLTSSAFTATGTRTVTFNAVGRVQLYTSRGNSDTIDVESTSVTTTINGGPGSNNRFRVSPFAHRPANILGTLSLNGGGNDILEFFDQNGSSAETYTFHSTPSMLRLGTLPLFACNFTGMGSFYLQTNGGRVVDPSGRVQVNVPPP